MEVTLLANNSQQCWMLHVASVCTPCCMLLSVVAQSLKPVSQTFESKTNFQHFFCSVMVEHSATVLEPFAQLSQHCWGHTSALHMISKVLSLVSLPQCTAGPNIVENCCTVCTPLPTRTRQLLTLLAHQCRELLRLFACM